MTADEFKDFLSAHKKLHPNTRGWTEYDANKGPNAQAYVGWKEAFKRRGIDQELAWKASKALQATDIGWPEKHLAAIISQALAIRESRIKECAEKAQQQARQGREAALAERDTLEARWQAMRESQREDIREQAREAVPMLERFGPLFHAYCLGILREDADLVSSCQ